MINEDGSLTKGGKIVVTILALPVAYVGALVSIATFALLYSVMPGGGPPN